MYCINCGAKLQDGDSFCDQCGTAVVREVSEPARTVAAPTQAVAAPTQAVAAPARTVAAPTQAVAAPTRNISAYSQRIDSPEVKAYLAMQRRWVYICLCIVVIAPIVGFLIYANCSDDITVSEALKYGPIVSLIMFCFGISPTVKQKLQKSYIGRVTEMYKKTEVYDDDNSSYTKTTYYIETIDTRGKKHKHKSTGYAGIFHYLQVGDEVRFMPQFPAQFEKKKEPTDTQTCCIFCQSIVSLDDDTCPRCKAPILK